MMFSGQLAALLSQACQGALVPESVRALIYDSNVFSADWNRNTMQDGANRARACVSRLESKSYTDLCPDIKRKASDHLGSESPSKRVKNSHSETITPEAEGKPRVVPFPEKVCRLIPLYRRPRGSDRQR